MCDYRVAWSFLFIFLLFQMKKLKKKKPIFNKYFKAVILNDVHNYNTKTDLKEKKILKNSLSLSKKRAVDVDGDLFPVINILTRPPVFLWSSVGKYFVADAARIAQNSLRFVGTLWRHTFPVGIKILLSIRIINYHIHALFNNKQDYRNVSARSIVVFY